MGQAIRTEGYRLVKWSSVKNPSKDAVYELYDYKNDPLETRNVYNETSPIAKRLKAIVESYPKPVAWAR